MVELAKEYKWIILQDLYGFGSNMKMKIRPALPDLMALIEHPKSSSYLPQALGAIGEDALNALIKEYKKSDKPRKQRILAMFGGMGTAAKPALPFLSQEYLAETDQELKRDFMNAFNSIIKNIIERQQFFIELSKKAIKSRKEKKKAQDRELDGVGVPINPLLL